jgi:hypothetical protein
MCPEFQVTFRHRPRSFVAPKELLCQPDGVLAPLDRSGTTSLRNDRFDARRLWDLKRSSSMDLDFPRAGRTGRAPTYAWHRCPRGRRTRPRTPHRYVSGTATGSTSCPCPAWPAPCDARPSPVSARQQAAHAAPLRSTAPVKRDRCACHLEDRGRDFDRPGRGLRPRSSSSAGLLPGGEGGCASFCFFASPGERLLLPSPPSRAAF